MPTFQYPLQLRFKLIALAPRIIVTDASGQEVLFVHQDTFKLKEDIHIYRLASELIVDVMVEPKDLRNELAKRYDRYGNKQLKFSERKHPIYPV